MLLAGEGVLAGPSSWYGFLLAAVYLCVFRLLTRQAAESIADTQQTVDNCVVLKARLTQRSPAAIPVCFPIAFRAKVALLHRIHTALLVYGTSVVVSRISAYWLPQDTYEYLALAIELVFSVFLVLALRVTNTLSIVLTLQNDGRLSMPLADNAPQEHVRLHENTANEAEMECTTTRNFIVIMPSDIKNIDSESPVFLHLNIASLAQ